MNSKLFTTLHPFMTQELKLRGAERDAFAVIFGFWSKAKKPVRVSITTIQEISGATRPTIVAAIIRLKEKGLLEILKQRGKTNTYNIIIPKDISSHLERHTNYSLSPLYVCKDNSGRSGNLKKL